MSQAHTRNSGRRQRDRDAIARSGAGCHICGKPIDYTLASPDPMSFEVDHIVPLSKHPELDVLSNKAASHRACNSTKRARDYAPIVRRSSSLD